MRLLSSRKLWFAASIAAAISLIISTALAHEGRQVGDYRFVVGWVEEPAYDGMKNGVDVRVTKIVEGQVHEEGGDEHAGREHEEDDDRMTTVKEGEDHGDESAPVEGLQDTLQVEVTHSSSGASRVLNLRAVYGVPGHYTAGLIPTAPGVYEFHVSGAVEGQQIDETFVSRGGGGDFDDIQSGTALQFPEQMTELRELESAVRGAIATAEQAQDTAIAAADEGGPGGLVLGVIGTVLGALGLVAGSGALLMATRRRAPAPNN